MKTLTKCSLFCLLVSHMFHISNFLSQILMQQYAKAWILNYLFIINSHMFVCLFSLFSEVGSLIQGCCCHYDLLIPHLTCVSAMLAPLELTKIHCCSLVCKELSLSIMAGYKVLPNYTVIYKLLFMFDCLRTHLIFQILN